MTEDYGYCAKIAGELRKQGIKVQVHFEEQKLGKKFKQADNIKVDYVIIIGEDEIANNQITLKNMKTGEQQMLKIEDAIETLIKQNRRELLI